MMDKNREAFETWCINQCNYDTSKKDRTGSYRSIRTTLAFKVWMASRQALEVDLENVSYVQVEEGTFYLSEGDVNESLTSLGIRVKGNEE